MSELSKRFEQIIISTNKKLKDQGAVMPVKTEQGILVGNVLIQSQGPYKTLSVNNEIVFEDICLNSVAIKLANLLAWRKQGTELKRLYEADREYNRHYIDSSFFLERHRSAIANQDFVRADIMWSRYLKSKDLAKLAKEKAERMAKL
jgi:hypothetical protein